MASPIQLQQVLSETLSPDANVRRNGKPIVVADTNARAIPQCLFVALCRLRSFACLVMAHTSSLCSAERALNEAQKVSGHPLQILQIVANADASAIAVRQAAAVHFKNVVKKAWDTSQEVRTRNGILS